jgi:hypothetical protein
MIAEEKFIFLVSIAKMRHCFKTRKCFLSFRIANAHTCRRRIANPAGRGTCPEEAYAIRPYESSNEQGNAETSSA